VLFDEEGLCLPRDDAGELYKAILNELTEELWCEYDWLSLNDDDAAEQLRDGDQQVNG
jgi:hypothetical protein